MPPVLQLAIAGSPENYLTNLDMSEQGLPLQDSLIQNYASDIANDNTGVYLSEEGELWAFANGSPKSEVHTIRRKKSQVDLVLPPATAFTEPGTLSIYSFDSRQESNIFTGQPQFFWPPVFGQKSVTWDQVFALIRRPELLWDCWKPSKSLDKYNIREQWACWSTGEGIINLEGNQTSVKPPLREVERHFGLLNLKDGNVKSWQSGILSKVRALVNAKIQHSQLSLGPKILATLSRNTRVY